MSSLQDKLYNYEQTPPANAWDKIAAALDESHLDEKFPSKLYNTEVAPPAGVWDKIAVAFDESNSTDQYPSRLYNAEVTPPAGVWNKIASSLEPEHAAVVPMTRKSSFLRYAAAAVLIGLVAFGVIKWANSNNSKSNESFADKNNSKPDNKENVDSRIETSKGEPGNIASGDNTDEVAATRQIKTPSPKRTKNNYSITDNIDATQPIYAYNEHTPNLADRYIMLMTPEGGIIRMSKKWGNLVCCVSGQEQDADCKYQLKKWQEKIACSPVASSNFMDILSLASTLNETEL